MPETPIDVRAATLQEVVDFFEAAIRHIFNGVIPSLLSPSRLSDDAEAFVAECNGQIVGAVTLVFTRDHTPRLDVLYVVPPFRRRRLGYRLCEAAISRFKALDKTPFWCDATSVEMHELLQRLLTGDRRKLVKERRSYLQGGLDLCETGEWPEP